MELNYHFRLTGVLNTETGHMNAQCALRGRRAKLGEDYGFENLVFLQARCGKWVTPEKLYVMRIYYADGMYRELGLKAVKSEGKTLELYGQKSVWVFTDLDK